MNEPKSSKPSGAVPTAEELRMQMLKAEMDNMTKQEQARKKAMQEHEQFAEDFLKNHVTEHEPNGIHTQVHDRRVPRQQQQLRRFDRHAQRELPRDPHVVRLVQSRTPADRASRKQSHDRKGQEVHRDVERVDVGTGFSKQPPIRKHR